ncbi:MAG: class I SAM-dependent methyltransferase, partial [Ilumatobacteraceae bacterium]
MSQPPITPLEQQQMLVARTLGDTFWHRVRFHLVGQAADRAGADTVLDIGAGSGQLGDWLVAQGRSLGYRFEETSPILDEALAQHFGADHRNDVGSPIAATTLVTMLDVLEHIEHDEAALRTINERMAPGSQLLLTVPAFQWAFTSWDVALGHHRRYSRRQVRRLAQAAGFELTSSAYLFPELLPLVAVRKLQRTAREHADFPTLPRLVDRTAEVFSRGTTA